MMKKNNKSANDRLRATNGLSIQGPGITWQEQNVFSIYVGWSTASSRIRDSSRGRPNGLCNHCMWTELNVAAQGMFTFDTQVPLFLLSSPASESEGPFIWSLSSSTPLILLISFYDYPPQRMGLDCHGR